MFDYISEVANNICIWTWEGRSAWCLSGPCLLEAWPKIDLSLLQRQHAPQEKHGRLHIIQHQSTGYLRTKRQEALYETCAACLHY